MPDRHTEFFGPDLARGPFSSSQLETSAVQIATALAQLRAPLVRRDSDILAHADFIRDLADRLAPAAASFVRVSVNTIAGGFTLSLRANVERSTLLHAWVASAWGGAVVDATPAVADWTSGSVMHEFADRKHWIVLTDADGTAKLNLLDGGSQNWYLAVARGANVFYAGPLNFS